MEIYGNFAEVYDMFMDNIPYDEWGRYVKKLLNKYDVKNGIVLDLGCGTGTMTEILADAGYDMIGVDNSQDMLNVAIDKKYESGNDILYLLQDMREFELYGTVAAIVSICDSINYITEFDDLVKVFSLVNNYLDPDGVFIFDMNTMHKYESMGDSVIAENRDNASFIWDNTYYKDTHINEYELTLFIEDGNGKFDRFNECHLQRAYTIDEVKKALDLAGLKFLASYDAFTEKEIKQESERMYIVARENGKVK